MKAKDKFMLPLGCDKYQMCSAQGCFADAITEFYAVNKTGRLKVFGSCLEHLGDMRAAAAASAMGQAYKCEESTTFTSEPKSDVKSKTVVEKAPPAKKGAIPAAPAALPEPERKLPVKTNHDGTPAPKFAGYPPEEAPKSHKKKPVSATMLAAMKEAVAPVAKASPVRKAIVPPPPPAGALTHRAVKDWAWQRPKGTWMSTDGTVLQISALSDAELCSAAKAMVEANYQRKMDYTLWAKVLDPNPLCMYPKEAMTVGTELVRPKLLEFQIEAASRGLCDPPPPDKE
jgi:hypothetical protein